MRNHANKLAALAVLIFAAVVSHATVVTQNLTVSFTCTGSTGPYPFTFPISDPTAMTVTQDGTVLSSTAYTIAPVNNNYDNGGSVTLNSACPSPQVLVLTRISPLTQTSVFTDNMPVPMATIENGLDKLTEIEQEQSDSLHGLWMLPNYIITAPAGNCSPNDQVDYVTASIPYAQYTCANGTWVQTGVATPNFVNVNGQSITPAIVNTAHFYCTPSQTAASCIATAEAYAVSGHAAIVEFSDATYAIPTPIVLTPGLTLIGVTPSKTGCGTNPTFSCTFSGGTVFSCTTGCFTGNGVNGSPDTGINDINLENLGFGPWSGTAVQFGDATHIGVYNGHFNNLLFIGTYEATTNGPSDKGFVCYNCEGTNANNVWVNNVNTGLSFPDTSVSTNIPGNGTWAETVVQTYTKSAANGNNTEPAYDIASNLMTFVRPQVETVAGDSTCDGFLLEGGGAGTRLVGLSGDIQCANMVHVKTSNNIIDINQGDFGTVSVMLDGAGANSNVLTGANVFTTFNFENGAASVSNSDDFFGQWQNAGSTLGYGHYFDGTNVNDVSTRVITQLITSSTSTDISLVPGSGGSVNLGTAFSSGSVRFNSNGLYPAVTNTTQLGIGGNAWSLVASEQYEDAAGDIILFNGVNGFTRLGSGTKAVIAPTIPGAGADLMTGPATSILNDCPKFGDTIGTLVDSGAPCGGAGSFTALTGDATSTSTGGATEVTGILNHALPSLTSGFLQWNGSALVWGTSTGPTLQTNGVSNSSQTALNFLASSVNACGLTWTPSNPSAGGEQGEISGTYSCTITSGQVIAGLGYTPANCTAGTSANNCLKLNSSAVVPIANLPDYPAPFAVPAANCVSGSPGSAWSTTIAPSCRAGTYNLGGNLPFADGNTAQFEIPIPADWDSSANAYARLNFTTGANTTGTIIFQIQLSCYTTGNSETDDQAFAAAQVFPTITAASANYANSVILTLNSTSLTGCAATGGMIAKITRNTDTAASVAPVTKAVITLNRKLVNEAQ